MAPAAAAFKSAPMRRAGKQAGVGRRKTGWRLSRSRAWKMLGGRDHMFLHCACYIHAKQKDRGMLHLPVGQ